MLLASARPLLSGLVIAALAAGLALADWAKRAVLHEPVVFADRSELLEVVRHPNLYLPFVAGPFLIAAVVGSLVAIVALLAWAEAPLWHRSLVAAVADAAIALAAALVAFLVPGRVPAVRRRLAALYAARLSPSGEPRSDAASLGPLACLVVHATLAADGRPARRRRAAGRRPKLLPACGPVVLVQAESFFDPARLDAGLAGLLPHYQALRRSATLYGHLDVPAWGANTVRTEFAVLSGLRETDLGLDRFNPYDAFAKAPGPHVPSLARVMRAAGYHTVFIHPFDLRFYARRTVLPRLGFDELVGPDAFAGSSRRGAYVADEELGRITKALVRERGPRVFVFIATMEAHGPWDCADPAGRTALPPRLADLPGADPLARWLWHLQGTDRMLESLADTLRQHPGKDGPGWLGLYGDHQPSMPELFQAAGFVDRRTDHLIWCADRGPGPRVADLPAHALADAFLGAMRVPALAHAGGA